MARAGGEQQAQGEEADMAVHGHGNGRGCGFLRGGRACALTLAALWERGRMSSALGLAPTRESVEGNLHRRRSKPPPESLRPKDRAGVFATIWKVGWCLCAGPTEGVSGFMPTKALRSGDRWGQAGG
jgi:hypothetical protein